jgi:hypothetical protein
LFIALQKYVGASSYDHIGVIVRRNDYPYLLEWNVGGIKVNKNIQQIYIDIVIKN